MKVQDLLDSEIGDTGKTVKEAIQDMDQDAVEELLTKIEEIAAINSFDDKDVEDDYGYGGH